MKICYIPDVHGFFKQVEQCKGNVWIKTSEGDVLNLKSKITQYITFATLFNGEQKVDMELSCDDPADARALLYYMSR